jgi:hypothetical protein
MSYLVFCTFDLKNATSSDYANAYEDLSEIGLEKVHKSTVIPTTSAMGEVAGSSAAAVRDGVRNQVKAAFAARWLKSEIFVVVGENWAWGAMKT